MGGLAENFGESSDTESEGVGSGEIRGVGDLESTIDRWVADFLDRVGDPVLWNWDFYRGFDFGPRVRSEVPSDKNGDFIR